MAITKDKVLEILKSNKCSLHEAKEEHKKLLMHVHGIGVTEYLTQIEGLENSTKIKLRKKLARSNKDLFADILRPTDKIFNSDGGSKSYYFSSEIIKTSFKKKLSSIVNGYSFSEWLETFYIDKYITDPNGLFFIEHKDNVAYPTYKSICSIRDYKQSGRNIEYIIFEPEKIIIDDNEIGFVRVYDDKYDYLYKYENDSLTLIPEQTYNNPWGYVPAITCSNIVNTLTYLKKSPIDEQVELADEYLRENSIKTLFKYHHGFPMFWQYMSTCPVCAGEGNRQYHRNDGETYYSTCHACGGTGYNMKKDVSDVTYIRPPESNETPKIAPELAGYIVPPIDSWVQMSNELKILRDMTYFSHWGTIINRDDKEKTAFEVSSNIQPMQDRLNKYSEALEKTESLLIDMIAQYYYKESYSGNSINYGRNYVIRGANETLKNYQERKKEGASYTVLNDLLIQYYHSLYAHDPISLTISLKLIEVEPFIHNTLVEVMNMLFPSFEKDKKIYYNDWLSSITDEYLAVTEIKKIKSDFEIFVKQKSQENGNLQRIQSPEMGQQN